ncbi:hypothetical protein [Carbonactinospora thermoautotrophica]|uniref:hypothetical protein n=1 Tax=Carbonactinospora thermoautotrophica TaxID=1469144 RepID=UPI001E36182D|nr:hypothetical protein [Carbonactinospora thermoautotrophica]
MRYAADVGHTGPGLAGEVAALVAALLPPRTRARAYWAANWPEWCDPVAPRVVAEPYREATTRWARAWVAEQVAAHAAAGRSWAQADAHDALWPHDVIPPAGEVPEASPFLHPAFLPAALALALADRYDPALPTPYQRCKAQIVKLFPEPMRRVLPRRKQYYSTTLVAAAAQPIAAPRAVAAGLLDPDALAVETDVAVRLTAAAVEDWLAGAEAAGAQLPRPARDHSGLL